MAVVDRVRRGRERVAIGIEFAVGLAVRHAGGHDENHGDAGAPRFSSTPERALVGKLVGRSEIVHARILSTRSRV
jgi:hypothetical protein